MRRGRTGVLALALFGSSSCGTTLGTIPLTTPGPASTVVVLDASRDVRFWSDIDATYGGSLVARYDVELLQDGAQVARAACDPFFFGPERLCTHTLQFGEIHRVHCRMDCVARVPRSGPTEVRASLAFAGWPVGFALNRASLIIKQ
jgi:hypothetical protein